MTKEASRMAQWIKNLPATQETQVRSLGQEDRLNEEMATHFNILMATHFNILAWRVPWTEEPGPLQCKGL